MMNQIEQLFNEVYNQLYDLQQELDHLRFFSIINILTLIVNLVILAVIYQTVQ